MPGKTLVHRDLIEDALREAGVEDLVQEDIGETIRRDGERCLTVFVPSNQVYGFFAALGALDESLGRRLAQTVRPMWGADETMMTFPGVQLED
jgi:hypothetical protein